MSSPRQQPRADPFWLCHECGAQMRPIRVDGIPHCASCNGEFIEILDAEVNPDPFHELPPAPPVRPASTTISHDRPSSPSEQHDGGGFIQGILGSLFGRGSDNDGSVGAPSRGSDGAWGGGPGQDPQGQSNGRSFQFNLPGGGQGRVFFGSMGNHGGNMQMGGMGMFGGNMGPFGMTGDQSQNQGGLESFFPGFAVPQGQQRHTHPVNGQPGPRPHGAVMTPDDLIQALMGLMTEAGGQGNGSAGFPGRMGDYATSQQSFDQIMEQLMQAAGPQGPLPASDTVIDGLPRFKLDEETLEKSQFKDCPVCKDDFTVGETVMRIPCKHIFHPDCLEPWLKQNGSCPVCRFSLLPDEGNTTSGPTASHAPPDPVGGSDWQSTITSTLNRLWGQSGAAAQTPSSPPTSPPLNQIAASPLPGSQNHIEPSMAPHPQPQQSHPSDNLEHHSQTIPITDSGIAPQILDDTNRTEPTPLSNAIPDDYRERHRRREREQNPYGEDLD